MKARYTCIAIDDDPLYLEIFEYMANKVKSLHLIKTYTNSVDGAMGAVKYKPDILFLDIEMPYLDGFEAMAALIHRPKIVIVSAHLNYNTNNLDLDISKFVSKPIKDPVQLENIVKEVMRE
ncbi:response regulator [Reichenbachiella sp. MALMAid0571]|uniref:LytR/AlgR family response regulator transcription factor n=1 Tax=Reichenbachiella sp. MALMAid0571 TaxID=3143939 RepID=UPI0032DE4934